MRRNKQCQGRIDDGRFSRSVTPYKQRSAALGLEAVDVPGRAIKGAPIEHFQTVEAVARTLRWDVVQVIHKHVDYPCSVASNRSRRLSSSSRGSRALSILRTSHSSFSDSNLTTNFSSSRRLRQACKRLRSCTSSDSAGKNDFQPSSS